MSSVKYFLAFLTIARLFVDANGVCYDCGFGGQICDKRLDECVDKIQLCDLDSDCVSSGDRYGSGYCHNGKCICYADENCPRSG
ncbi:hypothetical protein Ddc_17064 [Ditylenchus destructor]|nr:hypothetical protein Ddc_17064 [Ditylenchus destructor]